MRCDAMSQIAKVKTNQMKGKIIATSAPKRIEPIVNLRIDSLSLSLILVALKFSF